MSSKEIFKNMLELCFDEDFLDLHQELVQLEIETKKNKDYKSAMGELIDIIPLFTEGDFPQEIMLQIEELYENFLENSE